MLSIHCLYKVRLNMIYEVSKIRDYTIALQMQLGLSKIAKRLTRVTAEGSID